MMKVILGVLRADSGTISVFGRSVAEDPVAAKRQIGYVPESPQLYEFLTGAEYLDFIADMYGLEAAERAARIDRFLTALELAGHEHSAISGYSQGMKQKVALIGALLHRPRFLLLDEPLNALDPRAGPDRKGPAADPRLHGGRGGPVRYPRPGDRRCDL